MPHQAKPATNPPPLRPSPQNFRNAANAFRARAGLPPLRSALDAPDEPDADRDEQRARFRELAEQAEWEATGGMRGGE